MGAVDWALVAVPLIIIVVVGVYTQRYMQNVAGFLSGNRLAGRYLLAVSRGEMEAGAVSFVATFEVIAKSGFTLTWWGWMSAPLGVIIGISGFVIYRYRQTRALTLAQFFEVRYSRRFRLFTGMLGFAAGLLNFGIIPAVGARFFVNFLGLPPSVSLFALTVPTYVPLMGLFLAITALLAISGGFLTVMITDCLEGIISQILYLFIIGSLLLSFRWPQISAVLEHRPPGQSLLNPLDSTGLKDFNLAYVLMGMLMGVYGTMAWQNKSAYNAAALTAHESRMAGVLGGWRGMGRGAVITLLAICAMTFLASPQFAAQASSAHQAIGRIADPQVQQQMTIPLALAHLLPTGIKGALCVILLMGLFGGDATHLHSWSSLFVQDILIPLRKVPFSPQQHIRLLRCAIGGVAFFAFLFGSLFRQTEYIVMWWSVTQAVYVGGAGAAIIGGLYWKKGTSAGAWSAVLTGSVVSVGGILARQIFGMRFPFNGIEVSFYAMCAAILVYVSVSLLTSREDFDLDRMLHRGQYAETHTAAAPLVPRRLTSMKWVGKLIGYDDNFSRMDKWIAGGLAAYNFFWLGVMLIGTLWNYLTPWPESVWSSFWKFVGVGLPVFFALVTGVWFTWGGLRDIRKLFRRLRVATINPSDNGMVIDHQNLDDFVAAHNDVSGQTTRLASSTGAASRELSPHD